MRDRAALLPALRRRAAPGLLAATHAVRRIVLATNVAETSLTVPGIRYVVDTGVARISRYSRAHQGAAAADRADQPGHAPTSARAAAAASRRASRSASTPRRTSRAAPEFTDPEILRTNLASVILQMTSLGLGDIAPLPVRRAARQAQRQGRRRSCSRSSARCARRHGRDGRPRSPSSAAGWRGCPIDPRLGRMILEADRLGCVREVIVIAAALVLQDPRERPAEHAGPGRPAARALQGRDAPTSSPGSTCGATSSEQQRELCSSAFRRMCKREYLNYLRVREWQDFESQLRQVCKEMGLELGPARRRSPDADGIHQALLSGLLSHIGAWRSATQAAPGERKPMREYLGARGARFAIFPGSVLKGRNPPFVMAGELVETSRLWGRQNAAIKPEWAERLAGHLVKRTYSEPHWSAKRAAVMAHEKVTLYGVPARRRPPRQLRQGRPGAGARAVHPARAGAGGVAHPAPLLPRPTASCSTRPRSSSTAPAAATSSSTRRRSSTSTTRGSGAEVVSGAHFDQWWKRERRKRPDLLTFDPAMLTHAGADEVRAADFPTSGTTSDEVGLTFPLSYHFEPGAARRRPHHRRARRDPQPGRGRDFSWLVPGPARGARHRADPRLPKNLRVNFVPAPNRRASSSTPCPPGTSRCSTRWSATSARTTGILVPREAWDWTQGAGPPAPDLPGRRRGRRRGRRAARTSRRSRSRCAPASSRRSPRSPPTPGVSATGQTTWTFGTIEQSFTQRRAGHEVRGFPALVDEGSTVGLRVSASAAEAEARHRLGVRRLLLLALGAVTDGRLGSGLDQRRSWRWPRRRTPPSASCSTTCAPRWSATSSTRSRPVRDEAAFDALLARRAERPRGPAAGGARTTCSGCSSAWRAHRQGAAGRAELATLPALTDMKAQLARLVHRGFIGEAGRGAAAGVSHATSRPSTSGAPSSTPQVARDRQLMDQVADLQEAWLHQIAALPDGRPPERAPAAGAVDARGVPRLPVGPAARHRRTRSATSGSARRWPPVEDGGVCEHAGPGAPHGAWPLVAA